MNRSYSLPRRVQPFSPSGTALTRATSTFDLAGPAGSPWTLKSKVKLLVVTGVYVGTLLWAYVNFVSPSFDYEGFAVNWPGTWPMAWVITLILLPVLFLPYSISRPSALILWWL